MFTRRNAVKCLALGGLGLAGRNARVFGTPVQAPAELLIRRGRIVNASGIRDADIRVVGETIAEIGVGLRPNAGARVIEAAGRLIMPGGIDPHTHLEGWTVDDLRIGSMAALAGGITTIGTFAWAENGETLDQAFDRMTRQTKTDAIADVFFHAHAWPTDADFGPVMAAIVAAGQPSFKVYFPEDDIGAQLKNLVRLTEAARAHGVVTLVHCEDGAIIAANTQRLVRAGRTSLRDYPATRPVAAEVSATQQIAALAESTGAPLYVVHISSARALEACRQSRLVGAPLYVETRPLYLHLTDALEARPDAALYLTQPPLRPASDGQELWRGLADGRIDVLAGDHAPLTRARKEDPSLSITNTLPGMSDLQFMLPMYYSEGVRNRRLALQRFVETTSTNAARIFGMYPRKGVIREGSDADVVIWDPNRTGTVTADADLSNADYNVYQGWKVTGWPVTTIRRGEIVYDEGRVIGRPGTGRLIARTRWHR